MVLTIPCIESAEEEDDQTHNALSIPPLHLSWVSGGLRGADVRHQTQQAGVTIPI